LCYLNLFTYLLSLVVQWLGVGLVFDSRPGAIKLTRSKYIVGHINEVTLRRAGLILRWVTIRGVYVQPSHPGQLSLVILP